MSRPRRSTAASQMSDLSPISETLDCKQMRRPHASEPSSAPPAFVFHFNLARSVGPYFGAAVAPGCPAGGSGPVCLPYFPCAPSETLFFPASEAYREAQRNYRRFFWMTGSTNNMLEC